MNWELVEKYTTTFIKNYVYQSGFKNVVIGVSGGLDSAVVATLCVRALGAEHVYSLMMPFRTSSPESLEHGKLVCETLGIAHETIDISPSVYAYFNRYPAEHHLQIPNKCARERMSVLYDFSVRKSALVAGTSNKSEYLIGYCTQHGDDAAAFEPIADLYKTQVFEFARYLGVPDVIINKKPSADLWEGQTDEGEIGVTYKEIDKILHLWDEKGFSLDEIEEVGSFPRATIVKVLNRVKKSEFKRKLPPIATLSMLQTLWWLDNWEKM
jgi:NAD+ synthase